MTTIHEHLDAAVLDELRAVLQDDFPELINTFLQDSDRRLAMLRSGLAESNAEAMREAAHSFKGSSMNVGAHRLAGMCLDAETQARAGDLARMAALLEVIAVELRVVSAFLRGEKG